MKFTNYILPVLVLWTGLFKCQLGDNGYPLLKDKLFIESRYTTEDKFKNQKGGYIPLRELENIIPSFEIEGVKNQRLKDEFLSITTKDTAYVSQDIYGKAFYKEINISDDSNRIEYDGRYYYMYKISSAEALALQVYFKKYYMPQGSKLFFYNESGFILGEFNDKNNPDKTIKGLQFGTQPIPGNTFYIELSYPVSNTEKPLLITEKVIHSITDFYKGGAYGEAGKCTKNVACVFTDSDDKSRNIKSVGLMLYPIYKQGVNQHTYSATCTGNLMNNTKQDGTPYFLTAAHCIGAAAANNNVNWNTELITLFNYEAKTCGSDGSEAPSSLSNNSVLGCTVLTQASEQTFDYALLKLKGTASSLAKYKVCYAGWDNNPNSYKVNVSNTYGIHHPKGDVKKISFVKDLFPVSINQNIPFDPQNSLGAFLKTTWRDGIVEEGSSGSPLFNSFGKLIGTLSTGPKVTSGPASSMFTCENPDIYNGVWFTSYSRFSNNYYTMSPWLNPNGTNVQSIGPYCPNTSIQIGSPINITVNPGVPVGPQGGPAEVIPIDINGRKIHPSNTWGKKIYLRNNAYYFPENVNSPNTNFDYINKSLYISENLFAVSTNIYRTGSQQVIDKFELWGIYKIADCNKLKYLKPAPIIIQNPIRLGQLNEVRVDIVGITDDKVHIMIYSSKRHENTVYMNYELQTYKVVNDELVYVGFYPIAANLQPPFNGYFKSHEFNKNRLLLARKEGSKEVIDSYLFSDSSNSWSHAKNVIVLNYAERMNIKMLDDKVFLIKGNNADYTYDNRMDIYSFVSNSPNLIFYKTLPNIFLGNPYLSGISDIFKKTDKDFLFIYNKKNTLGGASYALMSLNISNNSVSHPSISDEFKYSVGETKFVIRDNEIIKITKLGVSSPSGEFPTHQYVNFINSNGSWITNNINFYKWENVVGNNKDYLITLDIINRGTINNYSINDRTLSIKEFNYLTHPYVVYNNDSPYYSGAYHRPKKIDHLFFDKGVANNKTEYNNLIYANTNYFPIGYPYIGTYYNTKTYDIKTVILDNKTDPVSGDKNVTLYGKYSIVMKPGFTFTSSSGAELHAIPQESLPADIPTCSFMFDDMLNPVLTETPDESLYLRQQSLKEENKPYYGEIILNEKNNDINQFVINQSNIKVYPNPTKGIVYINLDGKENNFASSQLHSIDGKILISKKTFTKITEFDLSHYPTGTYIITLTDKLGKTFSYKIVKK
ncbi:T9SS type A sorting domain-containing protein [Chryseobacterium sp. CT-SW4]|uniref:T9SS type A sorting domain-containing protein n=1 Tax=Chryseobacterium sp. SW-1 TaxID=3157343 RepID=UPI003B01F5E6